MNGDCFPQHTFALTHALEAERNRVDFSSANLAKDTGIESQVLFQFHLDFSKNAFNETKNDLATTEHTFRGTNQKTPKKEKCAPRKAPQGTHTSSE